MPLHSSELDGVIIYRLSILYHQLFYGSHIVLILGSTSSESSFFTTLFAEFHFLIKKIKRIMATTTTITARIIPIIIPMGDLLPELVGSLISELPL